MIPTGLDPVGPLFVPRLPLVKTPHVISRADADFVDVVHTNALIAGLCGNCQSAQKIKRAKCELFYSLFATRITINFARLEKCDY